MSKRKRAERLVGKLLISEEGATDLVTAVRIHQGKLQLYFLRNVQDPTDKTAYLRGGWANYCDRTHSRMPQKRASTEDLRAMTQSVEFRETMEVFLFLKNLWEDLRDDFTVQPESEEGRLLVLSESCRAFGRGLYDSFPKGTRDALLTSERMPPVSIRNWLGRIHAVQISENYGIEPHLPF